MKRAIIPTLACLAAVFLAAADAHGADEQWLQYRFSRQPWNSGVSLGSCDVTIMTEAPDGLDTPKFKSKNPWFGKWPTPMAQSGFVWLAFDGSRENSVPDMLYIDSDCDGSLADEEGLKMYSGNSRMSRFGPAKVVFKAGDGPVTFHLNVIAYRAASRPRIIVSAAGWYEGKVDVGGVQYTCRLVDYNANGAFNDASMDLSAIDRIWLDDGSGFVENYAGKFIRVGGALYHGEPAVDGACISFTPAADVPTGTVAVGKLGELVLGGENGLLRFAPVDGSVDVPAGRWKVVSWSVTKTDDQNAVWMLTGLPGKGAFDVPAGGNVDLSVGPPVEATITASHAGSTHNFSEVLSGRSGERVTVTRNKALPPAPRLRIVNADGSYNRLYSFSYG